MKYYLNLEGLTHFLNRLLDKFVAKVDGKGLSTNDYTTEEKEKLAGIENFYVTDDGNGNVTISTSSALSEYNNDRVNTIEADVATLKAVLNENDLLVVSNN